MSEEEKLALLAEYKKMYQLQIKALPNYGHKSESSIFRDRGF